MTNSSPKVPHEDAPCPLTTGPDAPRADPGMSVAAPIDVQTLLDDLKPALVDDLTRAQCMYPLGLLVVTRPRPLDVRLFELSGSPGRWHAAYPVFDLQLIALRYAREIAHQLWETPPHDAVWCLVLLPEGAVVVPIEPSCA